jgi:CheY-like chemotaxis protein
VTPNILIIEDNPADVRLLRIAFDARGVPADFTAATDGAKAMEVLDAIAAGTHTPRPNLILLDLNLPKVKGDRILQHVKSRPELADIPVVVLTTSDAPDDRELCLSLGAHEYMVKPTRFEMLMSLVARLETLLGVQGKESAI